MLANVFETSLLEHADELSHPDPELAIDVTYRFVYAALARRITHGPSFESPRETSDEELVARARQGGRGLSACASLTEALPFRIRTLIRI